MILKRHCNHYISVINFQFIPNCVCVCIFNWTGPPQKLYVYVQCKKHITIQYETVLYWLQNYYRCMYTWADMRVDDHTIHRLCVYFDSIESTQLSTIDITNIITVPYVGYSKAAALLFTHGYLNLIII